MRKALLSIVIMMVISTMVFIGCANDSSPTQTSTTVSSGTETTTTPQEVIHWKGQYAYALPSNNAYFPQDLNPNSGCGGLAFKNWIESISDGQIVVDMSPPGSIVPVGDMFKAVSDGTIDVAGGLYGGSYSAQLPEADIELGLPYAWPNAELAWDWYYLRGGIDMFQQLYGENNIYFMPVFGNSTYSFGGGAGMDLQEGIASIKGKKIRALGIYGELVEALGGVPVNIPGSDLYMAVKLGTVDGTIYGLDQVDSGKMGEVWNQYLVDPNMNNIVVNNLINKDKWDALPAGLRTKLEESMKYRLAANALTGYTWIKYWAAQYPDVQMVTWPDKDKAELKTVAMGLWDEIAARTPMAAEMVESIKQQQRELGLAQ